MKKVITIVGCRPNYLKIDKKLKQIIVNTGQHYDEMLKNTFFAQLGLPKPKYELGETKLGAMIDKLMGILNEEKPDLVVVYGDTNSTLAGAIAAKQCRIKLLHVEAGCRSGNMEMIEEQNRIMVDHISDYLITPCERMMKNLEDEKCSGRIGMAGNVMIDTLSEAFPTTDMTKEYGEYYLLTLHRAETVDSKEVLTEVFEAMKESNKKIIFPCHPRTGKKLMEFNIPIPENVEMIAPVDYKQMVSLTAFAKKVLTDSGGVQVEAHFLMTPCITLRNETEWEETLENGWNTLVGTDKQSILNAINKPFNKFAQTREEYYGRGQAKERIRNFINSL